MNSAYVLPLLICELAQGIRGVNPARREKAADEVTDVHRGFSKEQVHTLARILVAARLVETSPRCQEAQLNALCDIKAWHSLPRDILMPLLPLRNKEKLGPQAEYLDDLSVDC